MAREGTQAVSTAAGRPEQGHRDGDPQYALFNMPSDIVISRNGRLLYVCESEGQRVRLIDWRRGVSTLAGTGLVGLQDGPAASAQFCFPNGLALSQDERRLFVVDTSAHALRMVDLEARTVQTLVARPKAQLDGPFDRAAFYEPRGITRNSKDELFVTDCSRLYKVDLAARRVSFVCGGPEPGARDGSFDEALFHNLDGLVMTDDHTLWVCDSYNHCVRRIDLHMRLVQTIAGAPGEPGHADGPGRSARFKYPQKLALDARRERLFISELNDCIRVLDLRDETVHTLSGVSAVAGYADGALASAQFSFPSGLAWDDYSSVLYVADSDNQCIRAVKLPPDDERDSELARRTRVPTAVLLNALAQCRLSGIDTAGIEQLVSENVSLRDQNHLLLAALHDLQRRNDDLVMMLEDFSK